MSLNWVSRDNPHNSPFVPLPDETIKHAQPEPIVLELTPLNQPKPETITLRGKVYLTSHRIVVLSTEPKAENDNFSLLYKDILSHKLDMPWFGSNRYKAVFRISNADGGLNYLYQWELKVKFNEGGAVTFAQKFEELVTRFQNDQHDELPAYSET